MANHRIGTRAEWLDARLELLRAEKELTRLNDELTRRRRDLPWVRLDKAYGFDTEDGEALLVDLFRGRSQLIIYHLMFDPDWDEACPSCSAIADGFDKTHLHLQNHDVAFTAVSRAPLDKLLRYRDRMDWSFPWASSGRSDFNYDFHVTIDASVAPVEYNYRNQAELEAADVAWRGWSGEMPGMSAFVLEDGVGTTPTPPTRGDSTHSGPCGSGWIVPPSGATRGTCPGSAAMTGTRRATGDGRRRRKESQCLKHPRSTTPGSSRSCAPTKDTLGASGKESPSSFSTTRVHSQACAESTRSHTSPKAKATWSGPPTAERPEARTGTATSGRIRGPRSRLMAKPSTSKRRRRPVQSASASLRRRRTTTRSSSRRRGRPSV